MAILEDNLQGMRTRVRRWLKELDSDTSFWSDTFIDQMINTSYRMRCAELVMAHEGYFTNVATRDITQDQSRYSWPPGFERVLKLELVRSSGDTVPIERYERHKGINYANATNTADTYNPTFRPIAGGFVLEPKPAESVTDGIRIEYFGTPAELTSNGDSMHPDFPRSLDELVILDAAVGCMDSENLMESGTVRSILRRRNEWALTWERYIDTRVVNTNKIIPFSPHYGDA